MYIHVEGTSVHGGQNNSVHIGKSVLNIICTQIICTPTHVIKASHFNISC